jgi:hypothetical protein
MGKYQDDIFLTYVDSILVMFVYISLFMAYNLFASCFSFMNYYYRELR